MPEFDDKRAEEILKQVGLAMPAENSLIRAKNIVFSAVRQSAKPRLYNRGFKIKELIIFRNFKHMGIFALILAVVLGGGGTVAAAQNDLPGDTLYGVKVASEKVAETVTVRPEAKIKLEARFAERRSEEMAALAVRAQVREQGEDTGGEMPNFAEHLAQTSARMSRQMEKIKGNIEMLKAKDTDGTLRAAAVLETKLEVMDIKFDAAVEATSRADLKVKLEAARAQARELRGTIEKTQGEAADEDGNTERNERSAVGRVKAVENKLAAITARRRRIQERLNASGNAEAELHFQDQNELYARAVQLVSDAKAALEEGSWQDAWDKANSAFKVMVQYYPAARGNPLGDDNRNADKEGAEAEDGSIRPNSLPGRILDAKEAKERVNQLLEERLKTLTPEERPAVREKIRNMTENAETFKDAVLHEDPNTETEAGSGVNE